MVKGCKDNTLDGISLVLKLQMTHIYLNVVCAYHSTIDKFLTDLVKWPTQYT